ncbi:unnamed protein product (macronuclear) [Paramecium tetraurelia]|uniref:Uncharacterized protein n=1 Tax=Paramecium tetraurelia TaxID=5888 RepID=A0DST8_PARTE|nr:uncharacterized protein GSPATT00019798001 [Paramecium tetraurelia]CAK86105.1 unnamed protein product [Paramecium tetraurelia]|eukprot:XP_001453502.1 hypothetical protein (macronuclear) [Paramecium tetraurelia strain d4-2]
MSNLKSLMKMSQSQLASKCLALEELLERYYQFETAYYDLQSKYQILLDKYESICKKGQQAKDIDVSEWQLNKKNQSENEIGDRIEIYALEDIETKHFIQSLQDQNLRMQEQLKQNQIEFEMLKFKFDQTHSSPELNNQEGIISTLKSEISRLNKLVSSLRLDVSNFKTREVDENWLRQQLNNEQLLNQEIILSPQYESNEVAEF